MCYSKNLGYRNEMQTSTTTTTTTNTNTTTNNKNLVVCAVKGKLSGNKSHFSINVK